MRCSDVCEWALCEWWNALGGARIRPVALRERRHPGLLVTHYSQPVEERVRMQDEDMQGPWTPIPKLPERGAANG
eukprot:8719770-Pyramimonas_sp.AAC.1